MIINLMTFLRLSILTFILAFAFNASICEAYPVVAISSGVIQQPTTTVQKRVWVTERVYKKRPIRKQYVRYVSYQPAPEFMWVAINGYHHSPHHHRHRHYRS